MGSRWVRTERALGGILTIAALVVCAISGWLGATLASLVGLILWHPWRRRSTEPVAHDALDAAIKALRLSKAPNCLTMRAEGQGKRWVCVVAVSDGDRGVQRVQWSMALAWLDGAELLDARPSPDRCTRSPHPDQECAPHCTRCASCGAWVIEDGAAVCRNCERKEAGE